jgi:hypothetical protein
MTILFLVPSPREFFPKQLDAKNISVISAAGKDNFSNIVQLVLRLASSAAY